MDLERGARAREDIHNSLWREVVWAGAGVDKAHDVTEEQCSLHHPRIDIGGFLSWGRITVKLDWLI